MVWIWRVPGLVACACALSAAFAGELCIGIRGAAGYYLLPESVNGSVDQSNGGLWPENNYVRQDASASTGYTESGYHFSHPFDQSMKPNVGPGAEITYYFRSGIFLGAEIAYGFSVRDYAVSHTVADTMDALVYSSVPHDYRVGEFVSSDNIYLKSFLYGLVLGKRLKLTEKTRLKIGCGLGRAFYYTIFQIDKLEGTVGYYRSDGLKVYSEVLPSSFSAFGIRYSSFYVKPALGVLRDLSKYSWIAAELSCPLSYIEKGNRWSDGSHTDYQTVCYPSGRFVAGNLALGVSLGVHFGGGGAEK